MKRFLAGLLTLVFTLGGGAVVFTDRGPKGAGEGSSGIRGYAGPGWSVLFESGGAVEMASLGPVMFRAGESLFPGLALAVGPMLSLRLQPGGLSISRSGSDLAVMLSGLTAECNAHLPRWFTVTPRVSAGAALYGWVAPDDTIEGRTHFMIRPELCAYLGILPFLEIGGGIGYQFVAGKADTAIPLDPLSSVAFSIQVRVGER
jgi:hypothetical protein